MDSTWMTSVISGSAGILGAVVGTIGNWLSGNRDVKKQLKLNMQQRQFQLQDKEFDVYNQVLKLNGENAFSSDNPAEFNVKLYKSIIRPVLFNSLHVIHPKVRELVKGLDRTIGDGDWYGEQGKEKWNSLMISIYYDLIVEIEDNYQAEIEEH